MASRLRRANFEGNKTFDAFDFNGLDDQIGGRRGREGGAERGLAAHLGTS